MSRRSPSTEYTTYAFTPSSSIDYNYDPSGSTTKPTFDPYTYEDRFASKSPDRTFNRSPAEDNRNPSPPPLPPSSPSSEYILESQKPSARLAVPTDARKLLILDLNGTLLYRTSRVRREFRSPRRHSGGDHAPPPPQRIAHLRPYMPAFREYLFHSSTRAWLDTMVWSSAQPHSVIDMVLKCFGPQHNRLRAVWARDTLGLDERDYHRKAQTTKDLSKPWSKLPITRSSDPDTPQAHSAHTTLLMDDSPLKARLQPYNHLCIREYTGALRQMDLQCLQGEQRSKQTPNNQTSPSDTKLTSASGILEHAVHSTSSPSFELGTDKKHRRNKKKRSKDEDEPAEAENKFDLELSGYDPTLLAVVGVLERIKWEGNVAGWMKSGGLKSHLQEAEADADAKGENNKGQEVERELANSGYPGPSAPAPETTGETGQWFEDKAVLQFWVSKGVKALEGLGIQVTSGIVG